MPVDDIKTKKLETEALQESPPVDPQECDAITYAYCMILDTVSVQHDEQEIYVHSLGQCIDRQAKANAELMNKNIDVTSSTDALAKKFYQQVLEGTLNYDFTDGVRHAYAPDWDKLWPSQKSTLEQREFFLNKYGITWESYRDLAQSKISEDLPMITTFNQQVMKERDSLLNIVSLAEQKAQVDQSLSKTVVDATAQTVGQATALSDILRTLSEKIVFVPQRGR